MLGPFRWVVLSLFLLFTALPVFSGNETCSLQRKMLFEVADAQYFKELEGRTLSLRVSIAWRHKKTPELLNRVGCAIAAKYRNERKWNALVFSDYEAAKNYIPPYSDQNEPPEYLGGCQFVHDEVEAHVQCWTADPKTRGKSCLASSTSDDRQPSGPEIRIAEVSFSGALQMATSDQNKIAASIKQRTHGNSLDEVTDEAVERAKAGWQNQGYFKVQVSAKARTLTSTPAGQRIAVNFQVDEGLQYRLGEITFKHHQAISDVGALRRFFAIDNGDILSLDRIASGLLRLRAAYEELGYINFTADPNTNIEDESKLISIDIVFHEGRQYYLGGVNILGLDEATRRELLTNFPIKRGQIYDSRLFYSFVDKYISMFPDGVSRALNEKKDEQTGTITITFDFRPCRD